MKSTRSFRLRSWPTARSSPRERVSVQLDRAADYRRRLARIADEVVELWWRRYGHDAQYGGFHGTLDRAWRPTEPTEKSSVQQARHLWALATWAERRGRTAEFDELARSTYEFIKRSLRDPTDGELFYSVSRDGKVADASKILYAEAFGIFGLSTYGRVYGVEEATELAIGIFRSIDARAHDPKYGGYREDNDPDWLTKGAPKETNTHIHLMEGLGALLDATGDHVVSQRVAELVHLVTTKLIQPTGYVHQRFERDWIPIGPPLMSYGHDIETAWLLVDAARALGRAPGTVSAAALAIGAKAIREGLDQERGGLFDEGVPGAEVTSPLKIWWAQFEALAGLWWLHRFTGDGAYLDTFGWILDWIEGPQHDGEYGGWYFNIAPDGRPDERGDHKGEAWKTTYHALRAALFVDDWLKAAQPESGGNPKGRQDE